MEIHKVILQKLINKSNKVYTYDPSILGATYGFWEELRNNNELVGATVIEYTLYQSIASNESKYQHMAKIFENPFCTQNHKDELFGIFSKMQRAYLAMARFVHVCKYKNAKVQIDHDLYLNPIDIKKTKYITILQNNKKYMFTVPDVMNMVTTAITNAPNMFSQPLVAKNPYNNIPFNKSTLYNMYFFVKSSTFIMPNLFHNYFLANYDLFEFLKENEEIIREKSIHDYVFKTCCKELYPSVFTMLLNYHGIKRLYIHNDFPMDKLVDIMRPYLHLYYTQKYSMCSIKKSNAYDILQYKLDKFIEFNPVFGRRIVKQIRQDGGKKTIKTDISFNDKHINFYKTGRCNFNRGHLGLYDPHEEEEEDVNDAETEVMEEDENGEDHGEGDEHDEYREDYEHEPDEAGDEDEEDEPRESSEDGEVEELPGRTTRHHRIRRRDHSRSSNFELEEGEVEELPGRTTRHHRIRRRDDTDSSSYNFDSPSYNLMREFEREISHVPVVAIDSLYIIYNGSSNVQSEEIDRQTEIETGSSPSPTIDANRNVNDFYERYLNHP